MYGLNDVKLILRLPKKYMIALSNVIIDWLSINKVPERIAVLAKNLMAYKKQSLHMYCALLIGSDSDQ